MKKDASLNSEEFFKLCVFTIFLVMPFFLVQLLHQADEDKKILENQISELQKKVSSTRAFHTEADCLAKNIYFEAHTEPYQGKLAVATVTMNRVNSGKFPRTVCGVVLQKNKDGCQFSWVCEHKDKNIKNQKEYMKDVELAEEVLLSRKKSSIISSDVLYYHADYVEPYWAKTKKFLTKIGSHLFYRG